MPLIGTPLEVRIPGVETGFLRSLQRESTTHAWNAAREPWAQSCKPTLRELDLLPTEQTSLTLLLTSIVQNQLTLNQLLAELDAGMNNNLMSNRVSRPASFQ